ncbi:SH3 domain-containing protein [Sulfitobacter sp. F26169L]|uniref:SH3 domain-containing protein n=1 Tax=Sulfitobacter sp. F26169L TaxID=2996015 RepID=UPI00226085D6|nr:SH3 domain-containing protein [Sulfitobacter sp. F26169L]
MALFSAAGLSLLASGAFAQTYYVEPTSDGFLNLRSGRGTGHSIITTLYADDAVTFPEQRGNRLRVRLPDGEVGWSAEKYLYTYINLDGTV